MIINTPRIITPRIITPQIVIPRIISLQINTPVMSLLSLVFSDKRKKEIKESFKRALRDKNEKELKSIIQKHPYLINKRSSRDGLRTPYLFEIIEFCSFSLFLVMLNDLQLNIHLKDRYSNKIIHRAASLNRSDILEYLCSRNIFPIDIQNNYGCTALHKATHYNSIQSCKVLLKYYINKNITDKRGRTALHFAIMMHHMECAYVNKMYNE